MCIYVYVCVCVEEEEGDFHRCVTHTWGGNDQMAPEYINMSQIFFCLYDICLYTIIYHNISEIYTIIYVLYISPYVMYIYIPHVRYTEMCNITYHVFPHI